MVKKRTGCTIRYSTDRAVKAIWLSLLRDFRVTEGENFAHKSEEAFLAGINQFRSYSFPELGEIPAGRFKRWKQLSSLLKKYRFENDAYDDTQLYELTKEKFFKEQLRISTAQQPTPLCYDVLQRARVIAKGILGKYNPSDTLKYSRFGKKSSIGCPLSLAYIDEKLSSVKAFSGSSECSKWFFRDCLTGDPILTELVSKLNLDQSSSNLKHDSLNLVFVPKSWKVLRPITPLTLIALYYSYGVGEQVTTCLKANGLDLRRLQQRHRRLVERYSVSRSHATADLSSASDSLTSELLNRVLPREWYCAVKKTFSHQLLCDEKIHYTASVLPMGNGLTFPIETLVFYSILQAISELSKVRGAVSVYGDDLIYPSRLHKFVAHIFPRIGLVLNLDKTFVQAHFRESCGSDFYHGVDVRPAQIAAVERHQLTRINYQSFLYKVYNSLSRRWAELEIPSTLKWLLAELSMVSTELLRVPVSYPDTSGIKVDNPYDIPYGASFLTWAPIHIIYDLGSRWYLFSYLVETPQKRSVKMVLPYYWLALQNLSDDLDKDHSNHSARHDLRPLSGLDVLELKLNNSANSLAWRTIVHKKWVKLKSGKKVPVKQVEHLAEVSSRSGSIISVKTTRSGSISDWI